jgi:enterochelin esterase-like enzyme
VRAIPISRPTVATDDYPTDEQLPPLPALLNPTTACRLIVAHPRGGDPFWAAVQAGGTPLVDPLPTDPQHCAVTIVYRHQPHLRAVHALLRSITEPEQFDTAALRRLPDTDIWAITYRLDARRRGTYSIAASTAAATAVPENAVSPATRARMLAAAAPEHHAAILGHLDAFAIAQPDPLATHRRPDGASVMSLPQAPPLRWVPAAATEPGGVVHATLHDGRAVWHYTAQAPAGRGSEPLPVVIFLDGEDWSIDAPNTIAGMTAAGLLPPLLALGVSSGDQDTRWEELRCSEAFTRYLAHDVLGWAAQTRPITPDPARTIVAGQSLGGLAALFATQVMPERFGCALVQSGSFWWPANQEWLTHVVRAIAEPTHGVYLSVGTEEWAMREQIHRMAAALTQRGDPLHVTEYCGGHDLACWRVDLANGLTALTAPW